MEEKFVINIGRQIGSGGKAVGEALAKRLGVQVYDRRLITMAAEQSGICPEVFAKADEKRTLRSLFSTLFGVFRSPVAGEATPGGNILNGDALFKIQSDVIRDLASRESCIFIGRCADYVLRNHPRSLHVFISAPRANRIAEVMDKYSLSQADAETKMDKTDAARASYYNYYSTTGRWGDARTYHLCIDSSILGVEGTADLIIEFAERKWGVKL